MTSKLAAQQIKEVREAERTAERKNIKILYSDERQETRIVKGNIGVRHKSFLGNHYIHVEFFTVPGCQFKKT